MLMPGRDEEFLQRILDARKVPAGGVVLQPQGPSITETEITLQSNNLLLATLTNEAGVVIGYQLRFVDPYFHRTIVFPMSAEDTQKLSDDLSAMVRGKTSD